LRESENRHNNHEYARHKGTGHGNHEFSLAALPIFFAPGEKINTWH
jgi:hypothetical protein